MEEVAHLRPVPTAPAEAEDLAQGAFTKVFERWGTVAAMDDPAAYLNTTAVHQISPRKSHILVRNGVRRVLQLAPPT